MHNFRAGMSLLPQAPKAGATGSTPVGRAIYKGCFRDWETLRSQGGLSSQIEYRSLVERRF